MRNNQNQNRPGQGRTWSKFAGENLSADQYNSFKEQVMGGTVTRKTVMFSEFTLMSEEILNYRGVDFEMTKDAFKQLVRFVGLSSVALNKINNTIGGQSGNKLLGMMQNAMAGIEGKNTVCMIINKETHKITGFAKTAQGVLSNESYFSLFEDVMNNHSGMHIKNMAVSAEGNIEISVINNNWEFNVDGLKDEFFKSGLVFINTPGYTVINPFNERLVCTNGLVVAEEGMSLVLKNANDKELNAFFDAARNLKGLDNFEKEFKKRIVRMMDTAASYNELKGVKTAMVDAIDHSDPSVKETIEYYLCENEIRSAYLKQNIDLIMLDKKVWKTIPTMHTVWDLVNHLTDLSSHPHKHGLNLKEGNSSMFALQREAGELAFKDMFDLETPIKPLFNPKTQSGRQE